VEANLADQILGKCAAGPAEGLWFCKDNAAGDRSSGLGRGASIRGLCVQGVAAFWREAASIWASAWRRRSSVASPWARSSASMRIILCNCALRLSMRCAKKIEWG
jgi:hypothetical protein